MVFMNMIRIINYTNTYAIDLEQFQRLSFWINAVLLTCKDTGLTNHVLLPGQNMSIDGTTTSRLCDQWMRLKRLYGLSEFQAYRQCPYMLSQCRASKCFMLFPIVKLCDLTDWCMPWTTSLSDPEFITLQTLRILCTSADQCIMLDTVFWLHKHLLFWYIHEGVALIA